jgi:transcriptional regulator of acetoin/glycerol metabolism
MTTIAKSRNSNVLLPEYMPEYLPDIVMPSSRPSFPQLENIDSYGTIHRVEKAMLENMLKEYNRDIPLIAEKLGLHKSTVYRKIKRYNLA